MWLKADSDLTKSARSRRPRNQLKHPRTSYLINTDQPLVANLSNAARYPSRSSISHDTTVHIPCSAFIFISLYTMIYIFILPEFAGFWWMFDMFFFPDCWGAPTGSSHITQQDGTPVPGGSRSSPIVEVTRLLAWLVSRVSAEKNGQLDSHESQAMLMT